MPCGEDCYHANRRETQYFKHVSDLWNSSVAPWTLQNRPNVGGQYGSIQEAVCTTCQIENMIAKPIKVQISVLRRMAAGTDHIWCRCPTEVTVGCTCVRKQ
uniref:Interleukin 17a/f1 n=1 Tax=Nothobranchius furzeri TaxID=105023 RepID=A0A1A7Z9R1_NOTFU